MRAVSYHRVSTLDQHSDTARVELREAASRLGAELVEEIEETGSGARNDRPGLARVMDLARRHRIDVVLVSKLDRFGRSALDLLANVRELETHGVRFLATGQGIDIRPGGDPMSRLMLTMLAAVAEFERDLIRDRTRQGLDRARRAGRRLERPPARRPDPAEVAALRAAGHPWHEVAERLGCTVWACRSCEKGAPGEAPRSGS